MDTDFNIFFYGIGQKLAYSRSSLSDYTNANLVILQDVRFNRSVKEIWSMLGQFFLFSNMKIGARLLINRYRRPNIHPCFW